VSRTGDAVRWTGPLESAGLLTVLRVPARAASSARGVLPWAPLVGLILGAIATGLAVLGARWISPLTGAVLAVAVLAVLTRGLHLDGLADTADGLGPLRDREHALQVMHQSDVGPFGVVTLVLTLLLQVACAAALLATDDGWLALGTAVVVARLAMTRTGLPGVPFAEGSALGRMVAATVSRAWLAGSVLVVAALLAAIAALVADPADAARLIGAAGAGLFAAELLYRRATARLGGVTGDVMGAMGEVATSATLLGAAVLLG
jgi:adenosylcobinamide-GDP ribazoletransferase